MGWLAFFLVALPLLRLLLYCSIASFLLVVSDGRDPNGEASEGDDHGLLRSQRKASLSPPILALAWDDIFVSI